MPVDKFGRSTTDRKKHVARTGVTMSAISNSFVRRDGANTIIGDLNVTGNKIINVGDPTSNQDVATKGYADSTSVSKSGDTMTGDLLLTTGPDEMRLLGCTDLESGKTFSIALGSPHNFIRYTVESPLEIQSPVAMETTKGFAVKVNNSNVIQFGSRINVNKDIFMSDFRIKHLPDPISKQEPATKNYVDERKHLITIWAEAKGGISGEEYEWSFGSGSEGRGHRRSGYTMMAQGRILRMGMSASSIGNPLSHVMRTNIVINGRERDSYYVVIQPGQYSGTKVFQESFQINQGDRINFRSHTTNPNVCCAVVSLLIELDL